MTTRRRFLMIAAAAMATGATTRATPYVWHGSALGARATIRLTHPDAAEITARMAAEIDRLEDVFSLYRAGSSLGLLNAEGRLDAPPFELLECLSLSGSVHGATGGLFDPTVQRLWQAHATAAVAGRGLTGAERQAALALTGWDGVTLDETAITLRPGMALTLNGIAQGYIADRVAALLTAEGLTDILIDTGELRALGGRPQGGDWPVTLVPEGRKLGLANRALATSAPLGTVFDAAGKVGHILNPATGEPAPAVWQAISVSAPSAGLADALSTAACLMPARAAIEAALTRFPQTRLEAALPV
ncbi:FAD:protein FMN transferase [Paragemmobacter straminiformis]|uniref:FAD:protein FMN transferase n=1 Tax=Paragemmobacter straminiformis TaxID=2045119 RepID=A0A842IBM7_9RHOB|nr:FAD:protein FMN transferase [Gemmobacter straminiformis]MBC2836504.1 FAD:protein FMN transferase [Gemmobacter straminiformis]